MDPNTNPYEVQSRSPSGRFELRVHAWEARSSQWVESPSVFDVVDGKLLFSLASNLWSLNRSQWISESQLRVQLRKFPGSHSPTHLEVTMDFNQACASILDSPTMVALTQLEQALDSMLKWK